jgi:DNA polymerase-1
LSRSESAALIETYYKTYPTEVVHQKQIEFARMKLRTNGVLGRRRYLKAHWSQNAMVRGGAERNTVTRNLKRGRR